MVKLLKSIILQKSIHKVGVISCNKLLSLTLVVCLSNFIKTFWGNDPIFCCYVLIVELCF